MSFSNNIPDGFPALYDDDWKIQFQQLASRLQAFVNVDTINGESIRFRRLPKVNSRAISGRFGETNPEDIPVEYRLLFPHFSDCAHILDRREQIQLGAIGGPQEQIMRLQLAAAERDRDKTLIDGIRGDVQSGPTGGTILTFASESDTIPVNFVDSGAPQNSGMTFAKLLEVSTRFGLANVTGQDVENQHQGCVVLTHRQIKDLLLEEKMTSSDYGLQRLTTGEVVSAFGLAIKAVSPELLPLNAATDVRSCYAFVREAVGFGVAENPSAFVDVLPTKRHDIQLRTEWGWGATRVDPDGVIEILCDQSPA